jgi:hypothetical protein
MKWHCLYLAWFLHGLKQLTRDIHEKNKNKAKHETLSGASAWLRNT